MTEFACAPDADHVTVEMMDALETLRLHQENDEALAEAVAVLDRAGFFASIDEAVQREEASYARMMAGLRGIDLNDRFPRGDENGVIGRTGD